MKRTKNPESASITVTILQYIRRKSVEKPEITLSEHFDVAGTLHQHNGFHTKT